MKKLMTSMLLGAAQADANGFLTPRNLWNLSVQTAYIGIMATGMVLVTACGPGSIRQRVPSIGSATQTAPAPTATARSRPRFPLFWTWKTRWRKTTSSRSQAPASTAR